MKQKELASIAGVSERHISDIRHRRRNASKKLGQLLEYLTGIQDVKWLMPEKYGDPFLELKNIKKTEGNTDSFEHQIRSHKMDLNEIIEKIIDELERAESIHPDWPTDPVHAAAVMMKEAGETLKEANNFYHHGGSVELMIKEAVQAGAMVLRLLANLDGYERKDVCQESCRS